MTGTLSEPALSRPGSSAAMLDKSASACALGVSGSAWYTFSCWPGAPLSAKHW